MLISQLEQKWLICVNSRMVSFLFLCISSLRTPLMLISISELFTPERYSAQCGEVLNKFLVYQVSIGSTSLSRQWNLHSEMSDNVLTYSLLRRRQAIFCWKSGSFLQLVCFEDRLFLKECTLVTYTDMSSFRFSYCNGKSNSLHSLTGVQLCSSLAVYGKKTRVIQHLIAPNVI
jgi:hypothetical protein